MKHAVRLSILFSLFLPVTLLAQNSASQLVTVRHSSGQAVAPAYEGFDANDDGSFNLWFGYMNRNYDEGVDVPIGPDNAIEPGGDRGQPTHFVPRRHKDVFSVRVPKDFGPQTLTWTLKVHGQTEKVVATLSPVWQIDHKRTTRGGNSESSTSNTPPVVALQSAMATLASPGSTTVTVSATDDGLPKRRGQSIGMTVLWTKYRGPGNVTFADAQGKLSDGKASR